MPQRATLSRQEMKEGMNEMIINKSTEFQIAQESRKTGTPRISLIMKFKGVVSAKSGVHYVSVTNLIIKLLNYSFITFFLSSSLSFSTKTFLYGVKGNGR